MAEQKSLFRLTADRHVARFEEINAAVCERYNSESVQFVLSLSLMILLTMRIEADADKICVSIEMATDQ